MIVHQRRMGPTCLRYSRENTAMIRVWNVGEESFWHRDYKQWSVCFGKVWSRNDSTCGCCIPIESREACLLCRPYTNMSWESFSCDYTPICESAPVGWCGLRSTACVLRLASSPGFPASLAVWGLTSLPLSCKPSYGTPADVMQQPWRINSHWLCMASINMCMCHTRPGSPCSGSDCWETWPAQGWARWRGWRTLSKGEHDKDNSTVHEVTLCTL